MYVLWRWCETTSLKRGFAPHLIRMGHCRRPNRKPDVHGRVWPCGDGLWGWIATLFWTALFITVLPLVLFSRGTSDGARLWKLMRRPDQTRPWIALWALQGEETCGVLPRNWDPELVRQMLVADPTSGQYPFIQLLAFYRLADEKNEQVALEHLENALAKSARCSKVLRQCIFWKPHSVARCGGKMSRRLAPGLHEQVR
jgi:hypothetical protein